MQQISCNELLAVKLKRLDILIAQAAQELERYETFRMKLYEAMTDGLVDREEYHQMRKRYTQQIETSEQDSTATVRAKQQARKNLNCLVIR